MKEPLLPRIRAALSSSVSQDVLAREEYRAAVEREVERLKADFPSPLAAQAVSPTTGGDLERGA